MVIVLPATVATAVFELVYVNTPSLLVVGATIENAASPNVFVIAVKSANVAFTFSTVSVALVVPDIKNSVLS